jgi:O-antigen ligase
VTAVTAAPVAIVLRFLQNRSLWTTTADVFAILTAISLPWSTSLVAIFVACWLGAVALVMDYRAYVQSLKWPICFLPFALIGLALVGTLWSDAPWSDQLLAIGQTFKLIVLPALFYHFARSTRGMWVFVAFLASCAVLMAVSWAVVLYPGLTLKDELHSARGILVKNYIDQSQEFALCAVALAYPVIRLLQARKFWQATLLAAIALGFVVNMSFVIVSRTAMVTMPIMLAVFALLHLKRRTSLMIFGAMILLAGVAWAASPQLRQTTSTFVSDYELYKAQNTKTSIGLRLEYWRKSFRFFAEAPILGHGTGSIRGLFEQAAVGTEDFASGVVINNPHNQTLNVAVQWGLVGIVVLYAMWFFHLRLFRGEGLAAWIGLLVVVQNIFTSLFNSHIFDFHEGWMYVLGVGVAGGMTLRAARQDASTEPAEQR